MIRITIPERLAPHHASRASGVADPSADQFRLELRAQGSGVHPKPTRSHAKVADGAPAMPAMPAPPTSPDPTTTDPTDVTASIEAGLAKPADVARLTGAPASPGMPPTPVAPAASNDGAIELAPLGLTPITLPMPWIPPTPISPLEQAIQDLIARLAPTPPRAAKGTIEPPGASRITPVIPSTTPNASPTQGVAQPRGPMAPLHAHAAPEPRAIPEMISATSHVHLVVGDDAERVVVTVAVRGAQVTTTLRTADDQTAASLSRNAGSLDDAMRARGLVLAELDAGHDQHPPPRQPAERDPDHTPHRPDTERFALEEEA